MRDQNHLSVFTPAFLQRLDHRDRSGWTCAEAEYAGPWRVAERDGGHGADLSAILNSSVEWIGWCRLLHQELPDALHIAERFLRSPEALANLLEAASHEVVDRAGAILAGRLASHVSKG